MTVLTMRGRGFSLIEMIVTLVVMGVLAAVALPVYQEHVIKTRRSTAWAALLGAVAKQEQHFIQNRHYASSLVMLGYEGESYAVDRSGLTVPVDSTRRIYLIDLTVPDLAEAPMSYVLKATPQFVQVADSHCGNLIIDHAGVKSVSAGSVENCW